MNRADRIPVTVLTGFLGSGKTTVLNHLLRHPEFADTLVVINEFGQTALDHWLVAHSTEGAVIEMGNGCVCCSIRTDLARTLRDITWRFSRQGQRQFRRVWIETTGLADPVPVLQTLLNHPQVAPRYRLAGVVVTADVATAAQTLAAHVEAVKQVAVADVLLLTKPDLASPAEQAALAAVLRRLNPAARQQVVPQGVLDPGVVHGIDALPWQRQGPPGAASPAALIVAAAGHPHPAHQAHDPHEHEAAIDVNRHGVAIQAHTFLLAQPVTPAALQTWLNELRAWAGPALLRLKGVVAVVGEARPVVLQAVQHVVHEPVLLPAWPEGLPGACLVFITQNLDRATLHARLASLGVAPVPAAMVAAPVS